MCVWGVHFLAEGERNGFAIIFRLEVGPMCSPTMSRWISFPGFSLSLSFSNFFLLKWSTGQTQLVPRGSHAGVLAILPSSQSWSSGCLSLSCHWRDTFLCYSSIHSSQATYITPDKCTLKEAPWWWDNTYPGGVFAWTRSRRVWFPWLNQPQLILRS